MAAWRTLGSGVVALLAVQMGWAQPYPLTESPQAGDCFQYQLTMNLTGEIKVSKDGKPVSLKLAATATHEFPERILVVNAAGTVQKIARVYDTAKAVITLDGDQAERTLRPDRRLMVVQRPKDQTLVYCPAGALTREELELAGEHFDTLALTGLLPGKPVAVGETWKVANEVVQPLCAFEGLTAQDLVCKLEDVKDNAARVSMTGSASGIDLGAFAKLKIEGTFTFDLATHHLVSLEWKQNDERDQGPASPATAVEMTTTLKRTPINQPPSLGDVALVPVPDGLTEPPPHMMQLWYREPKGRYDLSFAREWQTVAQTDDHLVMRLLDGGDFVAQVTITPWTGAPAGQHLTPEAFQQAMAATPGWEQEEVLQSSEVPSDQGRWTYRVSALGKVDGMKLLQNFYLVASPKGDQVVLAFTMTQAQAEKLGSRDLSLAGSIEFPNSPKEADKPK